MNGFVNEISNSTCWASSYHPSLGCSSDIFFENRMQGICYHCYTFIKNITLAMGSNSLQERHKSTTPVVDQSLSPALLEFRALCSTLRAMQLQSSMLQGDNHLSPIDNTNSAKFLA